MVLQELKKRRKVFRASFSKVANEIDQACEENNVDKGKTNFKLLNSKYDILKDLDSKIYDSLSSIPETTEEELLQEIDSSDSYLQRLLSLELKFEKVLNNNTNQFDTRSETGSSDNNTKRKFKLPTLEFKKFSGELIDWLPFWAQYEKIHNDPDIDNNDKVEYIRQGTSENSKARRLVESFPITGENYEKIVQSLKSRFGREDLLIEVYSRKLLSLILDNALSKKKRDLAILYDCLETQIRALETLGASVDSKSSALLYPLIESCLPEDLIRVWQRSKFYELDDKTTLQDRLKKLLVFMRAEVENEQRIKLAAEGFGLKNNECNGSKINNAGKPTYQRPGKPSYNRFENLHTTTDLVNHNSNKVYEKCLFCEGSHDSVSCFKAQKMTLEQRRSKINSSRVCFRCLRHGHQSKQCRSMVQCIICKRNHYVIVCPETASRDSSVQSRVKATVQNRDEPTPTTVLTNTSSSVLLQTLTVTLKGPKGCKNIRGLLDSGSSRSYLVKDIIESLGYQPIRAEKLIHSAFGGQLTKVDHLCYNVTADYNNNDYKFEVLDQSVICDQVTSLSGGPWIQELKRLNINLSDNSGPIQLLIGSDIIGKLYTGRKQTLQSGLIAMETIFGWVLFGKIPSANPRDLHELSLFNSSESMSDLWKLEAIGITDPINAVDENQVRTNFLNNMKIDKDGRYSVRLPWLEGHVGLNDNYLIAKKRLSYTIKKLKHDKLLQSYDTVFKEWIAEGVIERCESVNKNASHYLPHRAVIKSNSCSMKIRPVFDASAGKPALNNYLIKGPNLLEEIPKLLTRFRLYKIGVVSDIRRAFLQIGIDEGDRDYLRFLWIDQEGNEITFRHRRVVFGLTCSPFLLNATIEHHLRCCKTMDKWTIDSLEKLMNSFYVDNCVTSVETNEQLKIFINEATEIMELGKFDLTGWEYTQPRQNNPDTSILGILWNTCSDVLKINSNFITDKIKDLEEEHMTKRKLLSLAQKLFDPIGIISPVMVTPKLILQRLWVQNFDWDQPVTDEINKEIQTWKKQLILLNNLEIPRWLSMSKGRKYTLHIFCDASKDAYAAVVFLRIEINSKPEVHFIMAKARITPMKQKLTIPRKELLAATIGARIYNYIKNSLPSEPQETHFWSDSSTVISWIQRNENWSVFVQNRVKEIRTLTTPHVWKHIPGDENPADLPSRGCNANHLLKCKWWEGPAWLLHPEETWPQGTGLIDENIINGERKKGSSHVLINIEKLDWHLNYFSSMLKTIRMVAWILRFINNSKLNKEKRQFGPLCLQEIKTAELWIIKFIQQTEFCGVEDNNIKSLSPFLDQNNIIRIKSRVAERVDTEDFCYPILLPGKNAIVNKLIFDTHKNNQHPGNLTLLGILRERYWITGGLKSVKNSTSKCILCKQLTVKKFEVDSPPLTRDRVKDAHVFEVTGVDFAGPLYIKTGKEVQKVWVCLFTCAIYRAVHLELATSLSTENFIQVLRRFVSRRGKPKVIYSDNGTNFTGLANLLKQIDWDKVTDFSSAQSINWKFNPPTASWWGGFWERLVGVMKGLLKKVLGKSLLNYEELLTVICECENIINLRPLIQTTEDPRDFKPITPMMFLRDTSYNDSNPNLLPDCDQIGKFLSKRTLYRQQLKESLGKRFRREYLGQLKTRNIRNKNSTVSIGDVVLVGSDKEKRSYWLLGKIEKLYPGKDGRTRLVHVKTQKGLLLRPVQRLYPLECSESSAEQDVEKGSVEKDVEEQTSDSESDEVKKMDCENISKTTKCGRTVKVPKRFL